MTRAIASRRRRSPRPLSPSQSRALFGPSGDASGIGFTEAQEDNRLDRERAEASGWGADAGGAGGGAADSSFVWQTGGGEEAFEGRSARFGERGRALKAMAREEAEWLARVTAPAKSGKRKGGG